MVKYESKLQVTCIRRKQRNKGSMNMKRKIAITEIEMFVN